MKFFDIEPICIYSDRENALLCRKYKFEAYKYKNLPIGEKMNFGISKALKTEWDYMMQIGSDDLIRNELLEIYEPYMKRKERHFGIGEVYVYDIRTGRIGFAENCYPLGCGRMIHREVFNKKAFIKVRFKEGASGPVVSFGKGEEQILSRKDAHSFRNIIEVICEEGHNIQLYSNNRNKTLDQDSYQRMAQCGITGKKIETNGEPYMLDIKSDTNIWNFETFNDRLVDIDILKYFPERNEIRKLRQVYSN